MAISRPGYTLKNGYWIRNGAELQGVTPESLQATRDQYNANYAKTGSGNDPYTRARYNYEQQRNPTGMFKDLHSPEAQAYVGDTNKGIAAIEARQAVPEAYLPSGGLKPLPAYKPPYVAGKIPANSRFIDASGKITNPDGTSWNALAARAPTSMSVAPQSDWNQQLTPTAQQTANPWPAASRDNWTHVVGGGFSGSRSNLTTYNGQQGYWIWPDGAAQPVWNPAGQSFPVGGGAAAPESQYQIDTQHGANYYGPTNPGPKGGNIVPPPSGGGLPGGGTGSPDPASGLNFDPRLYRQQPTYSAGNEFETGLPPLSVRSNIQDIVTSPEFQVEQADLNKLLNRQLLAKGRANSTFGFNTIRDANTRLLAQEYQRMSDENYNRNLQLNNLLYNRRIGLNEMDYGRALQLAQMSLQAAGMSSANGVAEQLANIILADSIRQGNLGITSGAVSGNLASSLGGLPADWLTQYNQAIAQGAGTGSSGSPPYSGTQTQFPNLTIPRDYSGLSIDFFNPLYGQS